MNPLLILLGVTAIWAYVKATQPGSKLATLLQPITYAAGTAPGITGTIDPPVKTANPGGLIPATGTVVDKPGTSGSGVSSSALQTRAFAVGSQANQISTALASNLPFYGQNPGALLDAVFPTSQIQPVNNTLPSNGCGCGGGCRSCGGCHRQDGKGDCSKSPSKPMTGINWLGYASQVFSTPGATPFNTFQHNWNVYQSENGDTPAQAKFVQ